MNEGPTRSGGITVSEDGNVATIVLSRAPLNILNQAMMEDLLRALDLVSKDETKRVLVLRSGVSGVFSAGADVREHLPAAAERMITTFERLLARIVSMPIPTIALVQGKCLGGGMEVAMACDFVLASEGASFGQPEIGVGVFPPGATALYPRLGGRRSTLDVVLTGNVFSASEAHAMGLLTHVASDAEVEARLGSLVGALRSKSRAVLALAKRAVNENLAKPVDEALRDSSKLYLTELMKTEDAEEGLSAFLEKRAPSWRDR